MPFTWENSLYNARASFNRWFQTNLTASGWPAAYAGGFGVNFEYPDVPLTFPSVSVTHLGGEAENVGNHMGGPTPLTGYRQHQLTDVNVWASGQANAPWVRDLWQIRDMVARLVLGSTGFGLLNVYGSTANPTAVGICRFGPGNRLEDAATPLEPSPNIHRHRLVVYWYYKTTT